MSEITRITLRAIDLASLSAELIEDAVLCTIDALQADIIKADAERSSRS